MATTTLDESTILESCRRSPNAFMTFVVDVIQAKIHRQLNKHLTDHNDCYVEYPRGHGKTTQLVGRNCWELGQDQTLRIKVVQQTLDEAKKSVALAKAIIESDEYRQVFPWVVPDKEQWGAQAIKVKAKRYIRDPSIEAQGIFGRAGGRADILEADDVCDLRNAIQQPALRDQVKEFWAGNWIPFLDETRPRPPRVWKVGTCYHVNDITKEWREQHGEDGSLLRLPVVGEVSPWPEIWTPDKLAARRRRMGSIAYGRAYELLPISSKILVWPAAWLESAMFEEMPAELERRSRWAVTTDWAFTDRRQRIREGKDPDSAHADYSVAMIGKVTDSGHAYVFECLRMQETFPTFKRRVLAACERYGVVMGAGEGNGPQKALCQQFDEEAPFPFEALERTTDKMVRAADRQSFVETGRFHILARRVNGVLRSDPKLQALYDEMTMFPAADHDDCVDAAMDFMDLTTRGAPPVDPGGPIGGMPRVGDMYR